ncbi:hypothetical protein PQX77_001242 [Marasmius sp. AFHP31]|nr:hypothetical protein PQX77_001242 [Marasmius sp. AFHP31]
MEWPGMPQYTTLQPSVNSLGASSSLNPYNSAEYTTLNDDHTKITMNFTYTNSTLSLVDTTSSTAFRYDHCASVGTGMSQTSLGVPSTAVNTIYANPTHNPTLHSLPVVPYPTFHTNLLHSQHNGVFMPRAPNPGYSFPSPYHDGDSSEQHWNAPVTHANPLYDISSFTSPSITYPSNPTIHTDVNPSFPVYPPHSHPTLPFDDRSPLALQEHWGMPLDPPQQ